MSRHEPSQSLAVAVGAAVVAGGAVLFFLSGGSRPRRAGRRHCRRPARHRPAPRRGTRARRLQPASPAPACRHGLAGPRPAKPARPKRRRPARRRTGARRRPLRIDSDVPGAQVFIDRQFIGTTPVTAENVTPGTHQLNVSAEGFDGIARSIEVEAGSRDLMMRFKEVRLDLRLPVVHQHRMGSCNGTLVATAQGLRTTTDDKDDRFTAPFGGSRGVRGGLHGEEPAREVRRASSTTSPIPTATPTSCSCSTATWTRRASA